MRRWWLIAAGLVALTVLGYANALGGGFVLDGRVLVLEDPRLRAATSSNLASIFTHTYWWPYAETPLYRPLTTLSFLFNYAILGGGDHPFGYHLVNLALHTANVLLVWTIARRIIRNAWLAALAAAIWAVHPLGTEAVTNIVGRADLLAAFGVLAAFAAHLRSQETRGRARMRWVAVSVFAAAMATFSKESAVALIGVIVAWDLLQTPARSLAANTIDWLAVGVPIAIFLALRSTVVMATAGGSFPFVDNPILGASFLTGRLTALAVAGRYVGLFFWPATLSADYSFQQIPLATGSATDLGYLLLLAVALVAIGFSWRLRRTTFFSGVAAIVLFLPVANLLFATGTIMAERLMYLPAAFLILALISAVDAISEPLDLGIVVPAALALVVVAFGIRTFARNADWRDELTLWTATVSAAPASFKSHSGLAESLREADRTGANHDRVVAEKEQSLAILADAPDPSHTSKALYEAATYHVERGEWRDAHREPGGTSPDSAEDYRRAIELAEKYLALNPSEQDAASARLLLAAAYRHSAQGDKAIELARQAATIRPLDPMVYTALASSLVAANRQDEAAAELMTGFMATGNPSLRVALIDLYRGGLDREGCAITTTATGTTLNVTCEIVRRHLCTASTETARLQRQRGRNDLAETAVRAVANLHCAATSP